MPARPAKSATKAQPARGDRTTATVQPKAARKRATTSKATSPLPAAGKATPKAGGRNSTKASPKAAAPITVTLKHLAVGLMERHGLPKKQADAIATGLFEQLVDHLKTGDRVRIGGLGIMEVKNRPARSGRNPATGEAIQIAASKKIAFRAAKDLKDAI